MTRNIRIVNRLPMGLDAVSQTFGFIGIRGSGKTYAATKLMEEMHFAGAQVGVIDPVGKWWGLRLDADGKSPGLDIPLFGGQRGDLPLDPRSGEIVARMIIETGSSFILDVSHMRKGQRKTFVTDFCETLFFLRAQDPAAMHLFLEEAHVFAPQMSSGQERMLGAVSDIVRLGRNHGLGVTLIDQRPQSVNKDVLNQTECLFAMRVIGKHERKAIQDWIRHSGVDLAEMADQLPTLKQGEAMLWSPSWLEIFKKVKILPKTTFDSSATPKVGKRPRAAKKLKPLDVAKLREAMSSFVDEAKANDPKELKATIAGLQRDLKKAQAETKTERVEVPVMKPADVALVKDLQKKARGLEEKADEIGVEVTRLANEAGKIALEVGKVSIREAPPAPRPQARAVPPGDRRGFIVTSKTVPRTMPTTRTQPRRPSNGAAGDVKLVKGARNMLIATARLHPAVISRAQMATLAGLSPKSGSFSNYLSNLRIAGYIEDSAGGFIATDDGLLLLGDVDLSPSTTEDLVALWKPKMVGAAKRMLDELVAIYPEVLTRAELAERVGISGASGSFSNYLSNLRSNGLLEDVARGEVRATSYLFPGV